MLLASLGVVRPRAILSLVLFTFTVPAWTAATAGSDPLRTCPRYRAHLQDARAALDQGDRAGALSALRAAREALRECGGEEARNGRLLAARALGHEPAGPAVGPPAT